MTAYALITGVIFRAPLQKTAKSGRPFTNCTVRAGSDDSAGGDFWSIVCFSESAQLELRRLEIGDAVAVRGKMEIKIYTANDGTAKISRSIFADAAIGLRPVPRATKPKAAKPAPTSQETTTTDETAATGGSAFFSDEIPFNLEWR
jgi:single-stranded DNA-binding protein